MSSPIVVYAFCESSAAGSLTPWHIRALVGAKKTGGGINTESLCGRVTPKGGGWDLEAEVAGYPLDAVTDGRRHVCKTCADEYSTQMGSNKPSVNFSEAIKKCCELLNGIEGKTRWPAQYGSGGISTRHERKSTHGQYSVSVDVESFSQKGRLGWKVRVSCNATQLNPDDAEAFAKLYLEAVQVARLAQVYMDSVEIDPTTIR